METIDGIWRHKKNQDLYKVITIGKIEATLEDCVIYQSIKDNIIWVRPLLEFCDGRFEKVTQI